ncbi:MAG: L-arabinose isomerase [Planctomycetota bacterium]
MIDLNPYEAWFITGSQHLYGDEALTQVAADSRQVVDGLNASGALPVKLVAKPVVTTADAVSGLCRQANAADNCVGLVMWMHTFSPAKMWIAGLGALQKPFAHLHTQFGRDIPWDKIDMDFMNLHQSAHGGREFGFICTRMRKSRKVIVGHWQDLAMHGKLATWLRAASAWADWQGARIARFGDNMRDVAVTEGDKVAAEMQLGYSVNGYGVGDLVERISQIGDGQIDTLLSEYDDRYDLVPELQPDGQRRSDLAEAARIELGMRAFLEDGEFRGFTTTFENLCGLVQLPGLAVQRLMADGYGFGAEGDWKTAALVRAVKVMGAGLDGGGSFMEDYVYHLDPAGMKVLGAHMLEVCESIAGGKPSLEIHPLGIGGKADPCRLVFNVPTGPAINATVIDLGDRFRMIVNEVDVVAPDADLPKLPVARAVWTPRPDLPTAAGAWIHAGGAHHTAFCQAVTAEHLTDFADMAGIECLLIGAATDLRQFTNELRWNEAYYRPVR